MKILKDFINYGKNNFENIYVFYIEFYWNMEID